MEVTAQMFFVMCPLVFLAGFIDSMAGGGGLISLPAYYLIGLPPTLAAGTNKLSSMLGTAMSTFSYAKNRTIDYKVGLYSVLGAIPGSVLGAKLLQIVPKEYAQTVIVLALPFIAFFVLRSKNSLTPVCRVDKRFATLASFLIGLVIGTYDGMIGPGTGTFLIMLFLALLGTPQMHAIGTARIVNLASNIGALVSFMLAGGSVLYVLGLTAGAFSILGNYLGAKCAIKGGMKFVRKLLIVVLIAIFLKLICDLVGTWFIL